MNPHGYTLELEQVEEGVALVRFADPGRRNRLCWAAVSDLADMLESSQQGGTRVAVLASALPGHWFEHACLADLEAGLAGEATTGDGVGWIRAVNLLSRSPLVTIAAISGDTCGGGCELGWACDLRVAEKQARFAQPEVRLGIPPGMGGVSRLGKLAGRSLAGEMVLDGGWMSAQRLHEVGAINRLVATGRAIPNAVEWARQMAAMPASALAACKSILSAAEELALGEALKMEQSVFQSVAYDDAAREQMRAQQRFYEAGGTTAESFAATGE